MTPNLAWGLLLLAGLLDVLWAGSMKLADGLVLPVGTAYAVWTGVGAVGTVLLGIAVFGEGAGLARLLCIALVVAGVVGLKLLPA
jgi:quaternary ammonium compound-resistance protein SugE